MATSPIRCMTEIELTRPFTRFGADITGIERNLPEIEELRKKVKRPLTEREINDGYDHHGVYHGKRQPHGRMRYMPGLYVSVISSFRAFNIYLHFFSTNRGV